MKFSTYISLYNNKATIEIKPHATELSELNEPLLELFVQGDRISGHATYSDAMSHLTFLIEESSYDGVLTFGDVINYLTESLMGNDGITTEDFIENELGLSADYMEDSQWRVNAKTLDSGEVSELIKCSLHKYDTKELKGIFNQMMDIQIDNHEDSTFTIQRGE